MNSRNDFATTGSDGGGFCRNHGMPGDLRLDIEPRFLCSRAGIGGDCSCPSTIWGDLLEGNPFMWGMISIVVTPQSFQPPGVYLFSPLKLNGSGMKSFFMNLARISLLPDRGTEKE